MGEPVVHWWTGRVPGLAADADLEGVTVLCSEGGWGGVTGVTNVPCLLLYPVTKNSGFGLFLP